MTECKIIHECKQESRLTDIEIAQALNDKTTATVEGVNQTVAKDVSFIKKIMLVYLLFQMSETGISTKLLTVVLSAVK